jgi:hypothetical protein
MKINLASSQRGLTYLVVVISAILVGLILATYLTLVGSQNQMTMRSQAWNRSMAVIEAGIEEALAHLNKNATFDPSSGTLFWNLWADGWSLTSSGWRKTGYLEEDYYVVTISFFTFPGTAPTISSEGYVRQSGTFSRVGTAGPMLAQVNETTARTYVKRSVLCTTTNRPMFTKALVAKHTIDLNGNNVRTDSFNSQIPGQHDGNGRYAVAIARDHGDIATNQGITNSGQATITVGNANVFGRASTGPNLANPGVGAVTTGPNGKVGDFAWHSSTSKGIKPGWSTDDMNMEFPDVVPPFSAGLAAGSSVTWTNGKVYGTVFDGGNDYVVTSMSGKVLVRGSGVARVRCNGNFTMSGQDELRIAPGARLILFMNGASAKLTGNGIENAGVCTNFYLLGTPLNTSITLGGNDEFTGVIYAPNAAMTGNGGGNDTMDFSGSATIKNFTFNGHYNFHYDEALPKISMYRGWVITSWNEL